MKLKGAYDAGTTYAIGDVVKYTDGIIYHLQKTAPAGTAPNDPRYWGQLDQRLGEAVCLMLDAFEMSLDALEKYFVDDKTIVLLSSTEESEKQFAITVDDDGEISATEIEAGE